MGFLESAEVQLREHLHGICEAKQRQRHGDVNAADKNGHCNRDSDRDFDAATASGIDGAEDLTKTRQTV